MFKAFGNFWQRFAEFKGRTNKRVFWLAAVAQLIVIAVLVAVCSFVSPFIYVAAVYALVCLTPSLAMCTRRLHDVNKKGSLMFVALIPVIGWIVCLVMFAKKGDEGENRFGAVDDGTVIDEAEVAQQEIAQPDTDFIIPPIYRTDTAASAEHNVDDTVASTNGAPAYNPTVAPAAPVAEEPAVAEEPVFVAENVEEEPVFTAEPVAQPQPVFVAEPAAEEPVFVAENVEEEPTEEEKPAVETQSAQPAYTAQSVQSIYDTPVYAYKPKGIVVTDDETEPAPTPAQPPQPEAPKAEAPKAEPPKPAFRPKGYRTKGFPYGH